jgi:hypothetical protein
MSEQNKIDCKKLEVLLEDYLGGALSRPLAENLAAHLESCSDCRAALDDARLSSRLAGVFEEAGDPGPAFTRGVMARIGVAERWVREQASFWHPIETLAWRLAFSAALALVLLFTYDLRAGNPPAPPTETTALAHQTDVVTIPVSSPPSGGDQVLLAIAEKYHERQ